MFLLQLKLAIRHLYRSRAFSLINLVGLSLGLASFIYVMVLISHETRFDRFIPGNRNIYRVTSAYWNGDKTQTTGFCNAPAGPELAAEIPGIDSFCRASQQIEQKVISGLTAHTIRRFRYADANFFNFFGFKLLQGSANRILDQPGAVVLTRSTAVRLFAAENPMGKIIRTPEGMDFVVTGVAEDPPTDTHLGFDAIAAYKTLENKPGIYLEWDGGWTFLTYLRLSPGVDPVEMTGKFPAFLENRINNKFRAAGWELRLALQPIRDIHLNSHLDYDCSTNRSKTNLLVIGTIAFLILLLAVINYINLATAIAFTRIRETGLRKIMGAARWQIRTELLAEALVLSITAGGFSLLLVSFFYPMLNQLTRSDFSPGHSPLAVALIATGASLITGLIAGTGPALMLSRQKALSGVQHFAVGYRRQLFRNGLVTFQFLVTVILIGTLVLMEKQNKFINRMDLGFDRHSTGALSIPKGFTFQEGGRIVDELKKVPGIDVVSMTSQMLGGGLTSNGYKLEGKEKFDMIETIYTDENFLDCFGIKMLAGRNFMGTTGTDAGSFLINRALSEMAGWTDPIGKFIDRNQRFEVIGVVDDFHFSSVYDPVTPLIISVNPRSDSWKYYFVNIRYHTGDIAGLLNRIREVEQSVMPGELFDFQFTDDYIDSSYKTLGQNRRMVSLFSILAILIAAIGLFGLSAFVTVSRRKEIGIRKVNGATTAQIMILLNYRMVRWVLAGFIIACPLTVIVMNRWLQGFAYKTDVSWWILAIAGFAVLLIAVLTVSWESFRAARKNPVETLHYE